MRSGQRRRHGVTGSLPGTAQRGPGARRCGVSALSSGQAGDRLAAVQQNAAVTITHPLLDRARALQPLIRERAAGAERAVAPDHDVVRAMAEARLFTMCAPAEVGGGEADPLTTIAVIEAVAEADGAAGWVLMIGAETTGIGSAHLAPEVLAAMSPPDRDVVICGALNPVARAVPVDGGFRATGQWPFASGSPEADWFWGQCLVEGGERGEAVEVFLPRGSFEVLPTWNSPGLRGTGSHDVRVHDAFVPNEHVTRTRSTSARYRTPLFRLPFTSRLAYNKVGVSFGIARAAIDHFVALANARTPRLTGELLRERPRAQAAVAEAEARLGGARGFCTDVVGDLWDTILRGDRATTRQQALVRLACSHAVVECATAVDVLYRAAGTAMSDADHPLARCFRDANVVGQHLMVSPHAIDDAGRVLLGLEPRSPAF